MPALAWKTTGRKILALSTISRFKLLLVFFLGVFQPRAHGLVHRHPRQARRIRRSRMTIQTGRQDSDDRAYVNSAKNPSPIPANSELNRRSLLHLLALGTATTALVAARPATATWNEHHHAAATAADTPTNTAVDSSSISTARASPLMLKAVSSTASLSSSSPVTTMKQSVSGLIAGAALTATKTLIKYPFDTATVRLQLPDSSYSMKRPWALFEGSYRGLAVPLLINVPAGALFFAVKDSMQALVAQYDLSGDWPSWLITATAVGAAQIPAWVVRNPSEVVKTRQQANLPGYGAGVSVWEAFRRVWRDYQPYPPNIGPSSSLTPSLGAFGSRWSAFYLGFWENILSAFPADVIKFVLYEQLLLVAGPEANLVQEAVSGAVSTAASQFVTTPLDVVRNRIMAQPSAGSRHSLPPTESLVGFVDDSDDTQPELLPFHSSSSPTSSSSSSSYLQSLTQLAQREGLGGLFAGAGLRAGRAFVSGAVQFATYEQTKQIVAHFF